MRNNNQANRWVLNVTAFVILLPVLLSIRQVVTMEHIQSLSRHGSWMGLSVVIFVAILYVIGCTLILWKGRLRLAIVVVFLSFVSIIVLSPIVLMIIDYGPRQLAIHDSTPGIDVYCNDVYLGKTPLNISETEFHDKVKPWDTPPRQKMMIDDESIMPNIRRRRYGIANTRLRWFYLPYNHFDQYRASKQSGFTSGFAALESDYWWHFERDGCTAVAAIGNKTAAEREDGLPLPGQWWNPSLKYPSVRPYLNHLLHNLKRSNYQPSAKWTLHVANASGLLFPHLYETGKRDSRVMRALEMAIKTEFGIKQGMSEDAWETVMDEVMSRSKRYQSFHTLSPESMVMDLLLQHNPKLIKTRFLNLLTNTNGPWKIDPWRVFVFGLNRSLIYQDPAEFLPLEYAVLKSCPPALFNRLVYESGRGERFLSMVANYSREEALTLARRYLNEADSALPSSYYRIIYSPEPRALAFAAQLQNTELELELRSFVLRRVMRGEGGTENQLREFIDARLRRPLNEDEAMSLAEWVAEAVPLSAAEKIRYLIRINSDRTHRYVGDILQRQPLLQITVVEDLIHRPNRLLDRFLIEVYQAKSAGVKFGGIVPIAAPRKVINVSRDMIRAMVLCDTPRMRTFLERIWYASNRNKIELLEAIKVEAPRHFPHLYDWTALISEIEDADTRLVAIPTLDRIDTPESSKVLADWARSSVAAVRDEAEWALAKYHERSRKAEALLASNIKPDDLLVGHTAYVWDGENYVPEETALGDK